MRSKLFVPASRPELFAKALAGPADAVSFDLEDAVESSQKAAARRELASFLRGCLPTQAHAKAILVRVNATATEHFLADLDAIAWPALDTLNLPKVEDAEIVRDVANQLEALERSRGLTQRIGILANIESPRGLRSAASIACAHPRVMGLQIGFGDLFAPLGIVDAGAKQSIRLAVRLAAGEAGISAFDGAYVDIADPDGYRRDAVAAHDLGFSGKSCIHPSQVELANEVFQPSADEIEHARRVVRASQDALGRGVGAFVVDGRLVDGPFIVRAERVLALARRLQLLPPRSAEQDDVPPRGNLSERN